MLWSCQLVLAFALRLLNTAHGCSSSSPSYLSRRLFRTTSSRSVNLGALDYLLIAHGLGQSLV